VLAAHLHDNEGALKLLDRTLSFSGPTELRMAETDPDLEALRDMPRFQKMIARVRKRHGLTEESVAAAATPPAAS
jgi:hypothetical protein